MGAGRLGHWYDRASAVVKWGEVPPPLPPWVCGGGEEGRGLKERGLGEGVWDGGTGMSVRVQ